MRRSSVIGVALAIVVLAMVAALGTARPAGAAFACYIQDPPPAPAEYSGKMHGSSKTFCTVTAAKIQLVTCLVRYNGLGSSSPRGCSTSVCYACTSLSGYTDTVCQWTTWLYTWRVSTYAIATIQNGTWKSPVALSNAHYGYCA
jgi:hypothetical protein